MAARTASSVASALRKVRAGRLGNAASWELLMAITSSRIAVRRDKNCGAALKVLGDGAPEFVAEHGGGVVVVAHRPFPLCVLPPVFDRLADRFVGTEFDAHHVALRKHDERGQVLFSPTDT